MMFHNKHLITPLLLLSSPLTAQQLVTSADPEAVSLTVYRATERGQNPINKDWPQGYALITETRTVSIPAGESLIRFEGVAEGMFPESAIVTGLPKGVKEKNRDARLLSPAGLVDAYLKRQVTLTRTNRETGVVRTQDAIITTGANGGVILQTGEGYEALRCTGLPERMTYGGVPAGLSAKPTLSVITQSDQATTAKLTLTYMASGFDWQANYIAEIQDAEPVAPPPVNKDDEAPDVGKGKVDIFAWLTLANGGNQSFINANTMAIAGEPARVNRGAQPRPTAQALTLKCWPMQRTHQVPFRLPYSVSQGARNQPSPAQDEEYALDSALAEDIVVTGSSMKNRSAKMAPTAVVVAEQEDLGDLKLYRIPEPVTVNAKGQKQVAMIVKPGAEFTRLYSAQIDEYYDDDYDDAETETEWLPMGILLRGENKREKGLGLPLPSGQLMLFEESNYGPLLAGQATVTDRAVGDEVEIIVGQAFDVGYSRVKVSKGKGKQKFKLMVTNARNEPVNIEIAIPFELRGKPPGVVKIDGVPTWKAIVPANGEAVLYYELKLSPER